MGSWKNYDVSVGKERNEPITPALRRGISNMRGLKKVRSGCASRDDSTLVRNRWVIALAEVS